jgi:NADH-quinone oxidoreductase subunit I
MKNTCTEKKNMLRYMKYVALAFFAVYEDACPKDAIYLTTSKTLVASSYEREDFIYGKDRLVMPLDIAMQNAQLKKAN